MFVYCLPNTACVCVFVYVRVRTLALFPLFAYHHLQYVLACALVCMHVFAVWLCKPEESKELSKVVALVSSARGL